MGFFIFQKYDTDVTFEKVMGQCHLSLTVAANDGEVLYRRKTYPDAKQIFLNIFKPIRLTTVDQFS